jgi:transposase
MREIINAIQYVLRSGCAWRLLPHDLPHWGNGKNVCCFFGGAFASPSFCIDPN